MHASHWSIFIENFAKKLTPPSCPHPSYKISDSGLLLETCPPTKVWQLHGGGGGLSLFGEFENSLTASLHHYHLHNVGGTVICFDMNTFKAWPHKAKVSKCIFLFIEGQFKSIVLTKIVSCILHIIFTNTLMYMFVVHILVYDVVLCWIQISP